MVDQAAARGGLFKVLWAIGLVSLLAAIQVFQAQHVEYAKASASINAAPMGTNPFAYIGMTSYSNTTYCDPNSARDGYPEDYGAYGSSGCQLEENYVNLLSEALALVQPIPGRADHKALADLGYNLVQLDNGWQGPRVNGVITPNPERYCIPPPFAFHDCDTTGGTTSDFTGLINQIKNMTGPVTHLPLEVGIYSDEGSGIGCNTGVPYSTGNGLMGHENQDASTFEGWGLTYLKIDYLCTGYCDTSEVAAIHTAFSTYAPDIRTDIFWCGPLTGSSAIWRLGSDECGCIDNDTGDGSSIFDQLAAADAIPPADAVGYNNWDDLDNLLVHGVGGYGIYKSQHNPWLSQLEQRTQFGLEALTSSPLLIGADVRAVVGGTYNNMVGNYAKGGRVTSVTYSADTDALKIVGNEDAIWVDQDNHIEVAPKVAGDSTYDVRSKILTNFSQTGTRAVGLLNRSDANGGSCTSASCISFSFNTLRRDDGSSGGLTNVQHVYYLWSFSPGSGSQDLVNSTGTVALAGSTVWYNCNASGCTFGNSTNQIPPHGLILLKVQGTST